MEMGFFDFVVSSSGRGYRVLNEYDCYDHDEYTFNLCLRDNQRQSISLWSRLNKIN